MNIKGNTNQRDNYNVYYFAAVGPICKELKNIYNEYTLVSKEYIDTLDLSSVANGQNQKRLSFERYVLVEYFDNILKYFRKLRKISVSSKLCKR